MPPPKILARSMRTEDAVQFVPRGKAHTSAVFLFRAQRRAVLCSPLSFYTLSLHSHHKTNMPYLSFPSKFTTHHLISYRTTQCYLEGVSYFLLFHTYVRVCRVPVSVSAPQKKTPHSAVACVHPSRKDKERQQSAKCFPLPVTCPAAGQTAAMSDATQANALPSPPSLSHPHLSARIKKKKKQANTARTPTCTWGVRSGTLIRSYPYSFFSRSLDASKRTQSCGDILVRVNVHGRARADLSRTERG